MSDTPAPPYPSGASGARAAPRPPPERGGASPKKSLVGRLAAAVAGHAYLALAAIIVLTLLVIGLYVYYHGLFFLGPYAAPPPKGRAKKKDRDSGAGADEAQGDPETERLIDSINQH